MNKAFRLVASTMLLVLGGTLTACHTQDSSGKPAAESMELKLYDVPAAQSEALLSALTMAMANKASVSQPAPGKVLVYAPREAQASIGKIITILTRTPMQQAVPVQVGVHFWIVNGESGAGADDAALKPLAPALDSVRREMGPLHFSLVQAVSARTSTDGNKASIVAAPAGGIARNFNFAVKDADGGILDLRLGYYDANDRGLTKFQSEISLHSGRYVVLAQGPGACPRALPGESDPPCPAAPALRLLIIRADILPPQA
jgi:hypothetical protein